MQAVVMRDRKLLVDEVPNPEPGPGQVLVKSLACGICGSDLHALKFAPEFVAASEASTGIFNMDLSRDVVMGHEFCVEVLAYGPDTEARIPVGERAAAMPGLLHEGHNYAVGYCNDFPGGYAEQLLVTANALVATPDSLPSEHAAMTEPMAVGIHAVRKGNIQDGEAVVVYGCGPVGLATIGALKMDGVETIIAGDFSPKRRELAAAMGADVVVDPRETPLAAAYREARGDAPAVLIECVGVPGMLDLAILEATVGSRIVVAGLCMQEDTIRPAIAINKEINLQFVLGWTAREFIESAEALSSGKLDVSPLVTGRIGLNEVAEAFETLGNPEAHAKIVVLPNG
ncbi:MAG TPA: zinc-binding dehydrogenase [Dehalococcoidia bacterium]|nr:zinc-binding dehydrogenase [Dehalococcoidia bacterium]